MCIHYSTTIQLVVLMLFGAGMVIALHGAPPSPDQSWKGVAKQPSERPSISRTDRTHRDSPLVSITIPEAEEWTLATVPLSPYRKQLQSADRLSLWFQAGNPASSERKLQISYKTGDGERRWKYPELTNNWTAVQFTLDANMKTNPDALTLSAANTSAPLDLLVAGPMFKSGPLPPPRLTDRIKQMRERQFHPPLTGAKQRARKPLPYTYERPRPLDLPSDHSLKTYRVSDRTFHVKRPPAGAYLSEEQKTRAAGEGTSYAIHDRSDRSLFFYGSGGGGRFSSERLIVENCTFVLDFQSGDFPGGNVEDWDPRRAGIFVRGFREVIVRNCVFISRMKADDPIRTTIGSVVLYDSLNVQVENCYFEGRTTGWRGHITAWGCGPTHIRNVEIAGQKQNGRYVMGGGIWVAHGEKIGWTHNGNPDRMIYPNGPLLIENTYIHDQTGDENTDGIYVQSIQPYLIRNTRVENWKGQDALVDVGFRDTKGTFNGKPLLNHGAVGVIEHCRFSNGYVKDSVGVAGGLIFRNNVMDNAWCFPYVFEGGDWWVIGNHFRNMTGVIASGRNNQLSGWTPPEGMFTHGSKMRLYNNRFSNRNGSRIPALFVNNRKTSKLKDVIVSDFNIYDFIPAPEHWAIDQSIQKKYSWKQWRALGNDRNSVRGNKSLSVFQDVRKKISLPGKLGTVSFGRPENVGLTGPVGVQTESVMQQVRKLRKDR